MAPSGNETSLTLGTSEAFTDSKSKEAMAGKQEGLPTLHLTVLSENAEFPSSAQSILEKSPKGGDLGVQLVLISGGQTAVLGNPSSDYSKTVLLQESEQGELIGEEFLCDCSEASCCLQHLQLLQKFRGEGQLKAYSAKPGALSLQHLTSGLKEICISSTSSKNIQQWQTSGAATSIQTLKMVAASGCFNLEHIRQMFPNIRQLTLQQSGERLQTRCSCKCRSSTRFAHLEQASLTGVCPTVVTALQSSAKNMYSLALDGCTLPSSEVKQPQKSKFRITSLKKVVRALIRRKFTSLPNNELKELKISGSAVDICAINRSFPSLQRLEVDCRQLVDESPAAGGAWFPYLESASISCSGADAGEPCLLQRPLLQLLEYRQSFGKLRLSQLAASCPRLQLLSLDPVMLDDSSCQLPHLQQLDISWCDSELVAQLAAQASCLQRLHVSDPAHVDKNRWSSVADALSKRNIAVSLDW